MPPSTQQRSQCQIYQKHTETHTKSAEKKNRDQCHPTRRKGINTKCTKKKQEIHPKSIQKTQKSRPSNKKQRNQCRIYKKKHRNQNHPAKTNEINAKPTKPKKTEIHATQQKAKKSTPKSIKKDRNPSRIHKKKKNTEINAILETTKKSMPDLQQ